MVGNRPPILCIPLDEVRHNAGVAIHAQSPAVQSNHLIRARVIEVEHVIDLPFEEERGVAVGLKLEAVPKIRAFAVAVPIAAHEIGIAVQRMGGPRLKQLAPIVKPVELRTQPAANSDFTQGAQSSSWVPVPAWLQGVSSPVCRFGRW